MPRNRYPISARALVEVKSVYAPSLSPDGKRVVFVVEESEFEESRVVPHLWMAETSGLSARQICFSYEGERAPKWSPDGRHIAFISCRPDMTTPPPPPDEEEEQAHKEQVWLMPADGGEARRITNLREGVRAFEWAPDSLSLVLLAPEPRTAALQLVYTTNRKRKADPYVESEARVRQQFWELLLDDGEPVLLHPGDYGIAEFALSPDGNRIAYTTNYTGDPNDYHRYDIRVLGLQDGADMKLVEREGGQFQPRWTPDGSRIVFVANRDAGTSYSQECLFEAPASGGGEALLVAPELSADVDLHLFDRKRGCLVATLVEGTNVRLSRIEGGMVSPILPSDERMEVGEFDIAPDGTIVLVAEGPASLPELYTLDRRGRKRALSSVNAAFLDDHELPLTEIVRWRSDEWEVEGLLTLPAGYDGASPVPLVVQVHGGPHASATCALRTYDMHAAWAAEGYAVLQPNYRGSSGYGNAFATASRRDLGGGDFRDILAGVDALVTRGIADPERVGIMGASYGGYMANWAACTSERFAAAISMFGVFNLVTSTGSSDIARWERDYLGAYYWEDPEIYRKLSPASYVATAKTPVLIIHGEGDTNTFVSNSIEMWRALKERGQTVEFARYPREGHGLREPHHRLDEMRRCLAWFDRYVKGADATAGPYRVGDRIEADGGYELRVLRAEDGVFAGWDERRGRLLEVEFAVSGKEPASDGWALHLDDLTLETPAGKRVTPRGVVSDLGGGHYLVEGRGLRVDLMPDRETGLLSVALAVAFVIPRKGGRLLLRVGQFAPVAVMAGPAPPSPERPA